MKKLRFLVVFGLILGLSLFSACFGTTGINQKNTHTHDFGDWEQISAPTCTEKGEKTRTCQRQNCSYSETQPINALGHDFENWKLMTTPDCTKKGEEARTCRRESCSHSEVRPINSLDHQWEWGVTVSATATTDGLEVKTCSLCSKTDETRTLYATGTPGLSYVSGTNNTAYSVSRGTITSGDVFIPAYHNGLPVTAIAANAFYNLASPFMVTSITFAPNSRLTTINGNAFRNLPNLKNITIPASVTTIDYWFPFAMCPSLESITVENGNTAFRSEENCLIRIADNMVILGLYNSTIPSDITGIGYGAFSDHTKLTDVTIPANVKILENYAFSSCSNLENVIFESDSLLEIIGSDAFQSCKKLKSIVIPAEVKSVGNTAFSGCSVLSAIYYGGATETAWNSISIGANNTSLTTAKCFFYSETQPVNIGDYWHYVDGIPTAW